ncbi:MAG: two-component regulator propeller domain-containing protein [Ginsengibacter sp.]
MRKKTFCSPLVIAFIALLALSSCSDQGTDIRFPFNDSVSPQPVSSKLQLGTPKKLNWVTVKTGGIHPTIQKLDIGALPSTAYDASGFKAFASAPEQLHFDLSALPDSTFNLEKIPSKPLHFKISLLAPPVIQKAAPLLPKSGVALSVCDFGLPQGLKENTVLSLLKDKYGLIWIGTPTGLYRYDGEYTRTYPINGAADLLEDNEGRIWFRGDKGIGMIDTRYGLQYRSSAVSFVGRELPRMIPDDRGRIWISQIAAKGADVIDPETETYKHLGRSTGISGSDTWGTFEDSQKNIWLTSDDGADIIDPKKGTIKHLKKTNGLPGDTLTAITGDKKGTVWIAWKGGGVAAVNTKTGLITNYGKLQGLDHDIAYRLLYDDQGMVWMATANGLSVVDPQNAMSKTFAVNEGIPANLILNLLEDDQQRVWVATVSGGLNIIDQHAKVVYPVGKKVISTLFEDEAGNIWVGTNNEGIVILNGDKKTATPLNKQNGFSDNFIQTFAQENGKLWISSFGGLDIIDEQEKTVEHTGQKEGLLSDSIYVVMKDRHNNIWLTGPSEGVQMIDSARNSIRQTNKTNGLSDNTILDVKEDKDGRIWLAHQFSGVDIINPKTWTVQNLNAAPGLRDTCFRNLMPDKYGRMWIGTDKGIYVADISNGTLASISTKEGLSNNYITSMVEYQNDVIVGTYNSGNIITPPVPTNGMGSKRNGKWNVSRLAKSEGLADGNSSWEVNIVTKNGRYLWGDQGITIINEIRKEQDRAATFITGVTIMNDARSFANHNSFSKGDTLRTTDSFYVKGQTLPNTGYEQEGKLQWDSVSGPYNMPVNLRIPSDQNYMQFQFAQASLGRQDRVLYSFILEGIDKKWSPANDRTFTDNYLNLPPGDYTFKVRSRGLDGKWSAPALFAFTILPPWYKSWWAYLIFALLIMGLLRAYIVFRSRRLKKENRVLEEKVALRTNELQKSLEELKSAQTQLVQSEKMASLGELTAGIAHEIQNPLNFVNNFSEVNTELIDEMKNELQNGNAQQAIEIADDIRSNQQKINFHGKRADAIVKGMLQHSRSSSGEKEPTDINALADEYLRLSYHGSRAKDKTLNASTKTDFDPLVGKVNVIPQDMGRVLLNLFNNAFYAVTEKKKLNIPGYDPTVLVSTKRFNGHVEISVKDNGNGIPQKVLDKIFQPFFTTKPTGEGTGLGLSISYDIIKSHGGTLNVETKDGEGSEFIIRLPVA